MILTDRLKPILLEVNANPSLRLDFDTVDDHGNSWRKVSLANRNTFPSLRPKSLSIESHRRGNQETTRSRNAEVGLAEKAAGGHVSDFERTSEGKLHLQAFSERHAQLQTNGEAIAQRVEQVAQRRLQERNEKLKRIRRSRFDIRLNPLLSRPLTHVDKAQMTPTTTLQTKDYAVSRASAPSSFSIRRTKSFHSGNTFLKKSSELDRSIDSVNGSTPSLLSSNLPQQTAMDKYAVGSDRMLKLIYSSNEKTPYDRLLLLDKVAYIYMQLVVAHGHRAMTSEQFRSFAKYADKQTDPLS